MTLAPGTALGPYRLEALIGSGGFATVWRAQDDRFDTAVALKVLAENHALNPDLRTRFVDEARMIRKVGSEHIVGVHDLGETPSGQPFLVLDLADRGDLAQRITERAPGGATAPDVAAIASFLVDALSDVHSAGLVHRDVKPGNVVITSTVRELPSGCGLLDSGERFLLADLGFAKDLSLASGYTSGGGSRWFQAPEQLPAIARVDHRADIYAASALVAWLLTGSVPNPTSTWLDHLAERRIRIDLSRGLAEDPTKRPNSMAEWHAAAFPVRAPSMTTTGMSRRQFLTAVSGVGVASAVVGGGTAWWLGDRLSDDPEEVDVTFRDGVVEVSKDTSLGPILLSGPATMSVDQMAIYVADGPQDVPLQWVRPNGDTLDATRPLELIASSTGIAAVNLQAVIEGRPVVISLDIDVLP